MKKSAFDKRNIKAGSTVIRIIVSTPESKRTTRKGIVSEITDTTITLIHNFKKSVYKIEDLIGITIESYI